jgi:hypothetical protein
LIPKFTIPRAYAHGRCAIRQIQLVSNLAQKIAGTVDSAAARRMNVKMAESIAHLQINFELCN